MCLPNVVWFVYTIFMVHFYSLIGSTLWNVIFCVLVLLSSACLSRDALFDNLDRKRRNEGDIWCQKPEASPDIYRQNLKAPVHFSQFVFLSHAS